MKNSKKKPGYWKKFPKFNKEKSKKWESIYTIAYLIKVLFYLAYGIILLVFKTIALPFTLFSKKKTDEEIEQDGNDGDEGGDSGDSGDSGDDE